MMYTWHADHWHWPQYVALAMYAFTLCCVALVHGRPREGQFNFAASLCSAGIGTWILWAGGFFA